MPVLTVFCSESLWLCQWIQGYSSLSSSSELVYLFLCWSFWSGWSWVLCRMISMDLFVFYIQTANLTSTVCWRCYQCVFLASLLKVDIHSSVDFGLLFDSIDQHFCFYVKKCFYYYSSIVQLEFGNGEISRVYFIIQDDLTILLSLCFQT